MSTRNVDPTTEYASLDDFDRGIAMLRDLPDTVDVDNTLHLAEPLTGRKATTYIVRRFRRSSEGDTLFLQVVQGEATKQIILPPKVMALLNRQDGVLTFKLRRQNGRRLAEERKNAGIEPGFMKAKKKGGGR